MIEMEFKIEKATRKAIPLLTMIYGKSGSGKTYSALKLAQGLLEKPEDRICLIDSENMRASYYSDIFDFDVINIESPHTPERYLKAFRLAESKYKVIIIDSFSLVWEGEGGCCDMADQESERLQRMGKSGRGLNIWLKPKREHKKLANAIYSSKAHKILCCRAKEKLKQSSNQIVSDGEFPVCESDVPYQMLIKFHLQEVGKTKIESCVLELLKDKLKINGYLNAEHGKIIKDWISEGEKVDLVLRNLKKECRERASQGEASLDHFLKTLPPDSKRVVKEYFDDGFKAEVRSIAQESDRLESESEQNNNQNEKLFNDQN